MIAKIILSIPKPLWFNFRYLPFRQAIHLPVWITLNCKIMLLGGVKCKVSKFAAIKIGFHEVPIMNPNDKTVINVNRDGLVIFDGSAHIGRGTKIHVAKGAILTLGDNFAISASTQINCYKAITFGRDVQFSWDCFVTDSDTHIISLWKNKELALILTRRLFLMTKCG